MPTEMTLKLTLSGVQQMIQSIQALNRALNLVNAKFGSLATGISQAAQRIQQAANTIKSTGWGTGNVIKPTRIAGAGQGNKFPDFDQQHLGSVLFSGFAGAWDIFTAKVLTRISTGFAQKFLGNHPLNPKNQVGFNVGGADIMPASAMKNWGDHLKMLTEKMLLIGAVIAGVIIVIKLFHQAVEAITKSLKEQAALRFVRGGVGAENSLRGIAAGLNMDLSEVSAMSNKEPGGARVFIERLKLLHQMVRNNPEMASFVGSDMGFSSQAMAQLEMTNSNELKRMIAGTAGISRSSRMILAEFNAQLGQVKQAFMELTDVLSPLLIVMGAVLMMIRQFLSAVKLMLESGPLGDFMRIFEGLAKANDKSSKIFSDAVDKFSDKIGTYGGGQRGKNPIPKAWGWYIYQQNLRDQVDRMGAFEF